MTGLDVDHFHATAIRSQIDVVAIQRQVLLWIARRKWIGRRAFLQCLFDHVTFDADDLLFAVHRCAIGFPNVQCPLGWKAHPHVFDDPQRSFVDFFDFFSC